MMKNNSKNNSVKKIKNFEPTRVSIMVSFVAVLALVLFAGMAVINIV